MNTLYLQFGYDGAQVSVEQLESTPQGAFSLIFVPRRDFTLPTGWEEIAKKAFLASMTDPSVDQEGELKYIGISQFVGFQPMPMLQNHPQRQITFREPEMNLTDALGKLVNNEVSFAFVNKVWFTEEQERLIEEDRDVWSHLLGLILMCGLRWAVAHNKVKTIS
jgi:hypothetical protein